MLKKQIKSAILLLSQEGRDIMTKVIVKNGNVEGALRVVNKKVRKMVPLKNFVKDKKVI